jgi:hypothetical protein
MKKAVIIGIIALTIFLIPFETTLVPEWKIRVVDENGNPYLGKLIGQVCHSYTLGVSPCSEANDIAQVTDRDGYVIFPERKIKLSLLSRIIRSVFNFVMLIAHGSFGIDVYLHSSGPHGYKTVKYVSGEPLPDKFILPSKSYTSRE